MQYELPEYFRGQKVLDKEEQRELAIKAQNGDMEAKKYLVLCNLGLIIKEAQSQIRRFHQKKELNEEISDLIQVGCFGFLMGVASFDPNYKTKQGKYPALMTYCIKSIKTHMGSYVEESNGNIRVPNTAWKNVYDLENQRSRLSSKNGEKVSLEDLTELHGIDKSLVDEVERILRLEVRVEEENCLSYQDDSPTPLETAEKHNQTKTIEKSIQQLDKREQRIIRDYFGLNGGKKTMAELGKEMEISRERVRQIKEEALKKLENDEFLKELIQK